MAGADLRWAAALVAALLFTLTGCSAGASTSSAHHPATPSSGSAPRARISYVALGDSYTAAPFVPPVTNLAAGCFRSSGNYPHLVAKQLGASLHDVSCGSATSADITGRQEGFNDTHHPPQIRAVGAQTRLVTVGIGGNDGGLFHSILNACLGWNAGPSASPSPVPPGSCAAGMRAQLGDPATLIDGIGRHVAAALDLVHRRAPRAVVVLVGYPQVVAATRSCPDVPLDAGDRAVIARIQDDLSGALARAARVSGSEYVDMHRISRGHEVCSSDPWVNGPVTDRNRALAFHPFAAEQRAVATAVLHLVHNRL